MPCLHALPVSRNGASLCEQAGTPEMFDGNLTKAQASKLIDEMREKANV
jgi:hypothetical protein